MKKKFNVNKMGGLILACSALAMSHSATAAVASATSTGYGLGLNLELLGTPLLDLALPAGATGVAPGFYYEERAVLTADASLSLDVSDVLINTSTSAVLGAEVITGTAASDLVGASVANKITYATGGIAGLDLGVGTTNALGFHLFDVLSLSDVTLSSNASVMGDALGSLSAIGDSVIDSADLHLLSILGLPLGSIDLSLYAHALPNTHVLDPLLSLAGISLIVNEQIENCAGAFCSLEVNALHFAFDSSQLLNLGLDVIATDIVLGHSYAEMTAGAPVPVPGAVWLFGSAIVGLIGVGRRQTKIAA